MTRPGLRRCRDLRLQTETLELFPHEPGVDLIAAEVCYGLGQEGVARHRVGDDDARSAAVTVGRLPSPTGNGTTGITQEDQRYPVIAACRAFHPVVRALVDR